MTSYYIQRSTITKSRAPGFSSFINAYKLTGMMILVMTRHQISTILHGPPLWADVCSGDHNLRSTWINVTHSTWHEMFIHVVLKTSEGCIVLGSMDGCFQFANIGGMRVYAIFDITCEADVVRATTPVFGMPISHIPCKASMHEIKSGYISSESFSLINYFIKRSKYKSWTAGRYPSFLGATRGERSKICSSLGLPPSFFAASPLTPNAYSRSTVTQKKNKTLLAV